jgi:hypothetical protein
MGKVNPEPDPGTVVMIIDDSNVFMARLLQHACDARPLFVHAVVNEPFRLRVGRHLLAIPETDFPILNQEETMVGLKEFFGQGIVDPAGNPVKNSSAQ